MWRSAKTEPRSRHEVPALAPLADPAGLDAMVQRVHGSGSAAAVAGEVLIVLTADVVDHPVFGDDVEPRVGWARSTRSQYRSSVVAVRSPVRMLVCQSPARRLSTRSSSTRPVRVWARNSVRWPTRWSTTRPPRRRISSATRRRACAATSRVVILASAVGTADARRRERLSTAGGRESGSVRADRAAGVAGSDGGGSGILMLLPPARAGSVTAESGRAPLRPGRTWSGGDRSGVPSVRPGVMAAPGAA